MSGYAEWWPLLAIFLMAFGASAYVILTEWRK